MKSSNSNITKVTKVLHLMQKKAVLFKYLIGKKHRPPDSQCINEHTRSNGISPVVTYQGSEKHFIPVCNKFSSDDIVFVG